MFLSSLSLEDLSNPVRAVFFVTQRGCCSDRQVSFLNSSAEGFFRRTGGEGGEALRERFRKSFVRAVVSQNFSRAYSRLLYN